VIPLFYFCDKFPKCTPILTIYTVRTRRIKVRLRLLPHLYSVTLLPSKTYSTAITNATFANVYDLKGIQNSLVLIPYSLNYSQQFRVSIIDEIFKLWNY